MDTDLKSARILIVDDEPAILMILEDVISDGLNCHIDTAENGLAALELAKQSKYNAICTDLKMPIMDGQGLIKALRESDGPNKDTGIIVISAYAGNADQMIAQYDNILILDKPINEVRLVANLKLIIGTNR